jgi:hypothetical protein
MTVARACPASRPAPVDRARDYPWCEQPPGGDNERDTTIRTSCTATLRKEAVIAMRPDIIPSGTFPDYALLDHR